MKFTEMTIQNGINHWRGGFAKSIRMYA